MSRRARLLVVLGIFLIVFFVTPFTSVVYDRPPTVSYWERIGDGLFGYMAFALIVAALVFGLLRFLEAGRRPI
jgi:hypothetical protein